MNSIHLVYRIIVLQIFQQILSSFVSGQSSDMSTSKCIPDEAHGVQRKVWTNIRLGWISALKQDSRYPSNPTKMDYITTLEAPRRREEKYGQTLTTYFFAPETGSYVFYMACDDECVLRVSDNTNPKRALEVIHVSSFTNYRQWEGQPNQRSSPIHMIQGNLYYVHAIMTQMTGGEHISIGVRLPSNVYERPLTSIHLLKYPVKGVENLTSLGAWGEWSSCTATCGGGIQTRNRSCLNSSLVQSGMTWTIRDTAKRVCLANPCPNPPRRIEAKMEDAWSVRVTWLPFDFPLRTSLILGYKLTYKSLTFPKPKKRIRRNTPTQELDKMYSHVASGPDNSGHVIIPAGFQAIMLSGLDEFTAYCIQMTTLTAYWESAPSACVNVTTDEFIPSLPPTNVTALNLTGPDKILITWSSVPMMHQNGDILGYEITIHRISTAKNVPEKDKVWTTVVVAANMKVVVSGLETYTVYEIRVAAFTSKGTGPYSKAVYAETCRCPETLYTNWWELPPLATLTTKSMSERGVFPPLLQNIIDSTCGVCHDYRRTVIDFRGGNLTGPALKPGIKEVKQSITSADVSFPIWVVKGRQLSRDDLRFVPVVEMAGGIVYINRKLTADVYAKMLGSSIFHCWPLLVLITVMCWLAGTILCILETISYPLRTCYRSSFLKGVYEYTWCAFVSMTTVGYGDRYPRSIQGRIFAIIWFIIGCITISLFVSTVSSSLSVKIVVLTNNPVQGGKVGVLEATPEYKVAVTINGTKGIQCLQYSNMDEMLTDLDDGKIDGILLNALSSNNLNKSVLPPSLFQVAKTFDLVVDYGIVLSGNTMKLERLFNKYIQENPVTLQNNEKNKKADQAMADDVGSEPPTPTSSAAQALEEEMQINFFDPSNTMLLKTLQFTSGFLVGAAICGVFFYYLTSRQHVQSDKHIAAKYQHVRSLDMVTEQRNILKAFYLRCMTTVNHLRTKHRTEQKHLIQNLRKSYSKRYSHISLKEYPKDLNKNLTETEKPVIIKHHREFVENRCTETRI